MMPEIIFRERTPTEKLLELQLDYNQHQVWHCQEDIAFCNINLNHGEPSAPEIEFCQNLIERANQRIRELSFERKALQLKLQNERRNKS